MRTKILLGCLGAVGILILVSFTHVVGIQSTASHSVNESPLFRTRTTRAMNDENNSILQSNYFGKGIPALSFPQRNAKTEQIQMIIELIDKMNDTEFSRFQTLILSHYSEEKNNRVLSESQLIYLLKQLKSNSKELKILLYENGVDSENDPTVSTCFPNCGLTYLGVPFCHIVFVIMLLAAWPLFTLLIIIDLFMSLIDSYSCAISQTISL